MGNPHGARSEQEYMKSLMVMKRHRSSQGGRWWQARVGYTCSRCAKKLEGVEAWHRPDTRRHRRWQVCSGQFPWSRIQCITIGANTLIQGFTWSEGMHTMGRLTWNSSELMSSQGMFSRNPSAKSSFKSSTPRSAFICVSSGGPQNLGGDYWIILVLY